MLSDREGGTELFFWCSDMDLNEEGMKDFLKSHVIQITMTESEPSNVGRYGLVKLSDQSIADRIRNTTFRRRKKHDIFFSSFPTDPNNKQFPCEHARLAYSMFCVEKDIDENTGLSTQPPEQQRSQLFVPLRPNATTTTTTSSSSESNDGNNNNFNQFEPIRPQPFTSNVGSQQLQQQQQQHSIHHHPYQTVYGESNSFQYPPQFSGSNHLSPEPRLRKHSSSSNQYSVSIDHSSSRGSSKFENSPIDSLTDSFHRRASSSSLKSVSSEPITVSSNSKQYQMEINPREYSQEWSHMQGSPQQKRLNSFEDNPQQQDNYQFPDVTDANRSLGNGIQHSSALFPPPSTSNQSFTTERTQHQLHSRNNSGTPLPKMLLETTTFEIPKEMLTKMFFVPPSNAKPATSCALGDNINDFKSCGSFGCLIRADDVKEEVFVDHGRQVYMNTHEPFCLVCVGVQGSGKSHTIGTVMENCLLHVDGVTKMDSPMSCLAFHFDDNITSHCEAASLTQPATNFVKFFSSSDNAPHVQNMIIMVSPSFYNQRKRFYKNHPHCKVVPLTFQWSKLVASQIRILMRLDVSENQLYIHSMLNLLRKFQREENMPSFKEFLEVVVSECATSSSQSGPLLQRLDLLKWIIADSENNAKYPCVDLSELVQDGTLVVADLTDPMISSLEANGVFEVLLDQYRQVKSSCGKLIVFDEAHKYLQGSSTGLAKAIVDTARQMRHHGMRIAISTQSPLVIPAELIELVTVAVLHLFQSKDWFSYINVKLPLPAYLFESLIDLPRGEAIVYARKHSVIKYSSPSDTDTRELRMLIRPRLTCDSGFSKVHGGGANTFGYDEQ
eukprot:m.3281 g.3281  ORF g.3281 m.3281 type:complete len:837 (-) comp2043_c0_seq1:117-2627(-)